MVSKSQSPLPGNVVYTAGNTATYRSHLGLKHRPLQHYPCLYVLQQPLVPGNTLSSCTWQVFVAINRVTNLTLSFPSQSFQGPNSPLSVWVSMLTFRKTTVTWLITPFLYVRTNFIIDFLLKAPKYFKVFFSSFARLSFQLVFFKCFQIFFLNICCTKSVLLAEPTPLPNSTKIQRFSLSVSISRWCH